MRRESRSVATSKTFSAYEKNKHPGELSDLLDGILFFLNHAFRQWSVGERGGHLLPIGHHPVEKISQDFAFRRIFRLRRNQQPGKAGNGIGVLAGSVRD